MYYTEKKSEFSSTKRKGRIEIVITISSDMTNEGNACQWSK